MQNTLLKILWIVWTAPNSLLGLLVGSLALWSGGGVQIRQGCLEFYGGWVAALLRRIPAQSPIAAMTLGHTILGLDRPMLKRVRAHEQVHVRQYEHWGPFFLPAYLGCSFVLWLRNRDPYMENPFEVEAYAISDPRQSNSTRES